VLLNGVRRAAIACMRDDGLGGSGDGMVVTLRDSMHRVADPENLDASVKEVFQMMLGVACERVPPGTRESARAGHESVTAVVGFGGLLSGACVFRCGAVAAVNVAAHMTGMSFDEVDDTVKDGVGEICNMLAGSWKSRVPDLAAHCGLSVPAVISGSDYNLHVQAPEFRLNHVYRFEDVLFEVTIVCDGLQ
jgi:chemotaxis protein CheX